jgi:hypothetical protein
VRKVVEERLGALGSQAGIKETVNVEWRGAQIPVAVISMPLDLLSYNPGTHRVRAQRSLDPVRDRELDDDPFSPSAQKYLHDLLMGDPTEPAKTDPAFDALKADLGEHGQSEPGIITRAGVLINGNTRRAALKELGHQNMRVGVLPPDAAFEDIQTIELSLQLRKDHKRDYSFMNFLLAVDERVEAGWSPDKIQRDFRIRAATFERSRWILAVVREAIARSQIEGAAGDAVSMRLIDFETHQGKLEELYRTYTALKAKAPDDAEALREQRLLAIALDKSKTDVRWIEPDFTEKYMKSLLDGTPAPVAAPLRIPGTSITAPGPSPKVESLRSLTTKVLKARSAAITPTAVTPEGLSAATDSLKTVDAALEKALDQASRVGRVVKKKFAAVDRISDANEDLELAVAAVAEARSTGSFDPEDLDEALLTLKRTLAKLAQLATREGGAEADGLRWLRGAAALVDTQAS